MRTLALGLLSLSLAVGMLGVSQLRPTRPATPLSTPTPTLTPPPSVAPVPVVLTGFSTYYDATRNHAWYTKAPRKNAAKYHQDGAPFVFYAAASPRLRAARMFKWGWEPYRVIVSNPNTGIAIVAWIVDECACGGGSLIDLSPVAWRAISGNAPLSRGVQPVEVELLP